MELSCELQPCDTNTDQIWPIEVKGSEIQYNFAKVGPISEELLSKAPDWCL